MKPPVYPADAIKAGVGAKVILKVFIDAHGVARSADIEKLELIGEPSSGTIADAAVLKNGFAQASRTAAMSWKYNPGLKDGKPGEGYALVPIDFSVHECTADDPCPDSNSAPTPPAASAAGHS